MGKEMPKEVIQYPRTDGNSGTEVSVHWSKGTWVQIGVTRHVWGPLDPDARTSPIHADHSACDECAREVVRRARCDQDGPQMMTAMVGSDAPPVGEFDPPATVFTEVMTRDEINKMIQVLRRARDQAFGKDA